MSSENEKDFDLYKQQIEQILKKVTGQSPLLSKEQVDLFYTFDLKINFAEGLKKLIDVSGINQKKLADEIGVEETVVSKWITLKALPNLLHIVAVVQFFSARGIKPVQTLFPTLVKEELKEKDQKHLEEINELKAKETVETYQDLEEILDILQREYNDAKLNIKRLKEKYKNLVDKIKESSNSIQCREDLLEFLIELEKSDYDCNDDLIKELETLIDDIYE